MRILKWLMLVGIWALGLFLMYSYSNIQTMVGVMLFCSMSRVNSDRQIKRIEKKLGL